MELEKARALAQRVVASIAPYCERIEIAGSIRRERAEVRDIDLVLIPKDLGVIAQRCLRTCEQIYAGPRNLKYRFSSPKKSEADFDLDLFIAHNGEADLLTPFPSNWGTVLLCRTGSESHNVQLCTLAIQQKLHWDTYRGLLRGGEILAASTEEEIYQALGLAWRPPTAREALSETPCFA